MGRIAEDLKEMRKLRGMSTRTLAQKIRESSNIELSYTTIQDVENNSRGIWLEDFEVWLNQFDSSIVRYLTACASAEELESLEMDRETIELVKRAIRTPERVKMLNAFLKMISGDAKRNEKAQK